MQYPHSRSGASSSVSIRLSINRMLAISEWKSQTSVGSSHSAT